MRKKLLLPALFILFCTTIHAQSVRWMMGTWNGTAGTMKIDDVSGESFSGTKIFEMNNHKTVMSISGAFRGRGLYLEDGEILQGEGQETSQGYDCSACTIVNKMVIRHDSLVLVNSISDCDERCNGETFFYRLLSEYDSATQRYLVDRFGRPSDIIGFRPRRPQEDVAVAANDNDEPVKNNDDVNAAKEKRTKDSLDNIARLRQQRVNDSTLLAQKKKRQQEIADSLNLVQQKERQRIQDSLDTIARIRQQQINDSILLAQQRKREKEIADSLNLAQQKEQQRIQDSLDNIARIRQQQINDSILLAQQRKREKEIADSLNLVQQKEQQHIQDSLDNIARIRQQQINDSILLAQQRKREKEIADSLNLAQQKEQQRIQDSLDNIARIRQQQINDSILLVQQRKREKEIADSLNLAQQKEQQRIQDSLDNIARIKQQRINDSILLAQQRKREKEIADSLTAVRRQQYDDSLQQAALAKAAPPAVADSSSSEKALTSRSSVLLGTYHITSPDILIELFDNAEIDGDRVSVYHNGTLIISNEMLDKKPITLNIHADTANREHEFVLVAENLGTIPPNSALMRVTAGKQSYRLSVQTDMKTNARIVFYYDGN